MGKVPLTTDVFSQLKFQSFAITGKLPVTFPSSRDMNRNPPSDDHMQHLQPHWQITVFLLWTGHCRLHAHLYCLGLSHTQSTACVRQAHKLQSMVCSLLPARPPVLPWSVTHTVDRPCETGPQTPEHGLQSAACMPTCTASVCHTHSRLPV